MRNQSRIGRSASGRGRQSHSRGQRPLQAFGTEQLGSQGIAAPVGLWHGTGGVPGGSGHCRPLARNRGVPGGSHLGGLSGVNYLGDTNGLSYPGDTSGDSYLGDTNGDSYQGDMSGVSYLGLDIVQEEWSCMRVRAGKEWRSWRLGGQQGRAGTPASSRSTALEPSWIWACHVESGLKQYEPKDSGRA